jgi:hypothetical protein
MATGVKAELITKLGLAMWCAAGCLLSGCAASTVRGPESFSSPQQAVERLEKIVSERSPGGAAKILGPEGDFLLHSGDEVLDRRRAQQFVNAFKEKHVLAQKDERTYILHIGRNGWPFPVPLVKDDGGWSFDAAAGRDEILARRIGENELRAMTVCRRVAQAQRIYAAQDFNRDGAKEYAAKLVSSPDKRDGLYWPAKEGEPRSPLGALVAEAAEEGYTPSPSGEPRPYHGYLFKILAKRPGPGRPHGSYWLIAHPAEPGETGVMLFAANERGWIYEKPSPQDPAELMAGRSAFKLDSSWTRVE